MGMIVLLADGGGGCLGDRRRWITTAAMVICGSCERTRSASAWPADLAQGFQEAESRSGHPQQHVDVRVQSEMNAEKNVRRHVKQAYHFSREYRLLGQSHRELCQWNGNHLRHPTDDERYR